MLQMSLLRLVFMGLQEADSKLIFSALGHHIFIRVATSVLVTLIQANLHAVPKPRPENARFACAPKQSATPEETGNWIVLAGSTAARGTRTQYIGNLLKSMVWVQNSGIGLF